MAADRPQPVAGVIVPACQAGKHVVSDRSAWSFLAYQGYGRGLDVEQLRRLSDWAAGGRWPELAVLIDVPQAVARERMGRAGDRPDRMEAAGEAFHGRVRAGLAARARGGPGRWTVVAGPGPPAEVAERVRAAWDLFLAQAVSH